MKGKFLDELQTEDYNSGAVVAQQAEIKTFSEFCNGSKEALFYY